MTMTIINFFVSQSTPFASCWSEHVSPIKLDVLDWMTEA